MRVRAIIPKKPLRDIALNHDELLNHAKEIAEQHLKARLEIGCSRLYPKVKENIAFLKEAQAAINRYIQKTHDIVPASEWFLDNYFLLNDLQVEIKHHLPRKYERQLPCILDEKTGHYPRVFLLMRELVEHTDSQISGALLRDFVEAYQSVIPLSSAELWAIPLMLRIILIENIRRLVEQILATQKDREEAERWIAPLLKLDETTTDWEQALPLKDEPWTYSPAYAERLLRRIRDLGVEATPLIRWLDRMLSKQDMSVEALAKFEHQQQAMCQVSMGHAITSLRFLAEEDWPRFFEEISPVHKILLEDPAGIFAVMDFASRDKYRHEIEKIARHYEIPETVVARKILDRARARLQSGKEWEAHIGYDLLDDGRPELERELEKEWGGIRRFWCETKRWVRNHPQVSYFGGIAILTVLLLFVLVPFLYLDTPIGGKEWLYGSLLLLVPISALTVPTVHWLIPFFVPPTHFPKLDFSQGIPEQYRTMVVVPTLLTGVDRVKKLLEQLEITYLANQDPHLHFAILGDFKDADAPALSSDRDILQTAIVGIEALNRKYRKDAFYLFHRKRLWNEAEKAWMGWERKRGKLIEFNRLLLNEGPTSYEIQIGDQEVLSKVQFVITLDADTELPRGIAQKLVGTLAHPLHRPHLDETGTRIIRGYGVLQPRVAVSVLSAHASLFASTFSGKTGIDPYTTAVSDVYQDLFGEGIFTGKGIYDVNAFHKMTGDVFPENRILSHDLLEGLYARAGLVTDLQLIDGYPGKYLAFIKRLHRWIRGDWQIIAWLGKDLPLIAKWKIVDNLRRSLEAPFQILLIVWGFLSFTTQPYLWAGFVGVTIFWPSLLSLLNRILRRKSNQTYTDTVREFLYPWFFQASTLLYLATMQLDAIIRSLIRQFLTHRHLLEWETAADAEQRLDLSLQTSLRKMGVVWFELLPLTILIGYYDPYRAVAFLPLAFLWGISPFLAYRFSLPLKTMGQILSPEATQGFRLWARRIWAFFEDYVGEQEHWLPPDNVQIDPPNGIAHRTSPTNIGFALLSNIMAFELGYQPLTTTLDRVEGSLATLEQLEKWHGHLYNWYDTLTLEPLQPLYISTVDSGNLVVYLLTLSQGLEDLVHRPFLTPVVSGLIDTYRLVIESKKGNAGQTDETGIAESGFAQELFVLNEETSPGNPSFASRASLWQVQTFLAKWANVSLEQLLGFEIDRDADAEEMLYWAERLQRMIRSFADEFTLLFPALQESTFLGVDAKNGLPEDLAGLSIIDLRKHYRQACDGEVSEVSEDVKPALQRKISSIDTIVARIENFRTRLKALALQTDFKPLFDSERQLFSIGYRVQERALDRSYYDLLASEARQAGFIAIAKGDVPEGHWFRMGRALTEVNGRRSLVSWSGTMFEFMMPLLLMRNYPGTLWDETYQSVVTIQRLYGREKGIPWGISESGYYAFDLQRNYQYKAFGVPGLGLKRGLVQELVIAPYATFLALMIDPLEGFKNLNQMVKMGFAGRYGFYEAIDFTRERVSLKQNFQIVKSYMAHHQGMSFLALSNVLFNNRLHDLFHREPIVQATELLLQERLPGVKKIVPPPESVQKPVEDQPIQTVEEDRFLTYQTADTAVPLTHFVSNGEYSVMMTNAGSGYSRFQGLAVSRWREDVTKDSWGMYFYIQNLNSGEFWSTTQQPCLHSGENYRVTFAPDRIEYYRKDGNISTKTEVAVSPEDAVETRRITLTNHSEYERTLEITSYFEVVLMRPQDEMAHPAFANLFVETEYTHQALIATRRPRKPGEKRYYLMHTVAVEGEAVGSLQYETDRARFLGRGGSKACPLAMELNRPLSNTVGAVLDPIMSLRQRVRIKAGKSAKLAFSTGITSSREEAIRLAEKYREPAVIQRVFELAWTQSQMELHHLKLTPSQANDALSLGSRLLYLSPARREYERYLLVNRKGQSSLWPYAISGDVPVVLVLVKDADHLDFVREALTVHEYWRMKGLIADLVILNQDKTGYIQSFQEMLRDLVSVGHARDLVNQAGGIFLLQQTHLPQEDLALLYTVARAVFAAEQGSFLYQIRKMRRAAAQFAPKRSVSELCLVRKGNVTAESRLPVEAGDGNEEESAGRIGGHLFLPSSSLLFFNGYGGFNAEGTEYVILLKDGMRTPLPWINVLANPRFGCQISESGAGYTWSGNSRENKLTPWSNDPVLDPPGEVLYLRKEKTGEVWCPTPAPVREVQDCEVRHGHGYTRFKQVSHGIRQELLVFVPIDKSLKILKLTLKNLTDTPQPLTLTYYVEWVMGVAREQTAPFIITEYDEKLGALLARNTYQEEFAERVAFLSGVGAEIFAYTGDRTEFIGRNGDLSKPEGLTVAKLSGSTGAGLDPCGVLQYRFELGTSEEKVFYLMLGEGANPDEVKSLLAEFRDESRIEQAFQGVQTYWSRLLGRVTVRTPEQSMDLLLNRWLLYQTIVCRIWARSAFYQSGGAYGFRDQLQDVMALTLVAPEVTRSQILLHCAHQFVEGDVQHWWHAEKNKGIRTKFSDDLLWLPFVTADYWEQTQDDALLEETVPYLEDRPLGEEEDERYSIPQISDTVGTVYDHCIRALERGLKFGEHGLPLIGSGDWNDGFSRIGTEGKGESVWLGWFLIMTLNRFAPICERRQDAERARKYRQMAEELRENMEKHAWDGGWYRRAYFDDGTPLGSRHNPECQIDAIAQSWGVISRGARPSRVRDSMTALENYLWRKEDGILLLLTPPFDRSALDPGYIKGYVPGVRENGGQYTHGAIWAVLAFAMMGEGNKALELFNMLNPINHARTSQETLRYKVEPYVMAADIYANHPHTGRGGWSWYTGAAGWMYQVGMKGILGLQKQGERLVLNPCIPSAWQGYKIDYRYKSTLYHIKVENPHAKMTGIERVTVDGIPIEGNLIDLHDDGKEHVIVAQM